VAEAAKTALAELIKKLNGRSSSARIKTLTTHNLSLFSGRQPRRPLTMLLAPVSISFWPSSVLCLPIDKFELSSLRSPQALAKSARFCGEEAATNAPITETPFDCYKNFKVKQGSGLDREKISSLSFMAKFGRPL
jgi:hypothetical protein